MDLTVSNASQFKVKELSLVTKAGSIDITSLFVEINIFDSIFMSVITGNIIVLDSVGLSSRLFFDGSETLLINLAKDDKSDIAEYKRAFRIYKQSERTNINQNTESYTLHFVADEQIFSDQQRVNQSFDTTYSDMVEKILLNYLKVRENNLGGIYETTNGLRKVVIPNLRPLEAIEWCAKRSVDKESSPNFVFFQNSVGFNFVSLSTLLTQDTILDINFSIKNKEDNDSFDELSSARNLEVISQNDTLENTRTGVYAGKFIGFDPITRSWAFKNVSYGDHYTSMKHGNKTPNFTSIQNRDKAYNDQMFDSKKTVSIFGTTRRFSNYVKNNDPDMINKTQDTENVIFQRTAIMKNLMNKKLKLVMPGNFQLSSGFNVSVTTPTFGSRAKDESAEDETLSGNYLIVASRQIIKFDRHETIIEVASTSNKTPFVMESNPIQTEAVLDY